MFNVGDVVQSKTGGPKLVVLKVEGDTLYCARSDDPSKQQIAIHAANVCLYHEEGDFGVC